MAVYSKHSSEAKCAHKFLIEEKEPLLTADDVGTNFIRTQPFHGTWDCLPTSRSEEKIRSASMELMAYHSDGSMEFSNQEFSNLKFSKSWNDGCWISVDKCVQLFKDHATRIKKISYSLGPMYDDE